MLWLKKYAVSKYFPIDITPTGCDSSITSAKAMSDIIIYLPANNDLVIIFNDGYSYHNPPSNPCSSA